MHNVHGSLIKISVRVGALCAVGLASVLFAGCGELGAMREPGGGDLQLTTDMLKASVRDAQRMAAELRADLEARRPELAEAQIVRAQLEGRVREAERRVTEARQVIELQREELAIARMEREHLSRSRLQLQGQMKQLQKQLSKIGKSDPAHDGQEVELLPSSGVRRKDQKTMQVPVQRNQPTEFTETPQMVTAQTLATQSPVNSGPSSAVERRTALAKHVSVKPGDTLWSIAQKYRVDVEHLRTLNQLTDDRIVIGQALRIPGDRSMSGVGADKTALTP
jgi:LysM repeat protein